MIDANAGAPLERVAVLLPLPLAGPYDYAVPDDLDLKPGELVIVPLGGHERPGIVWGRASGEVAEEKLKRVAARIDCPPFSAELRRFVDWVGAYNLTPPGAVLRMCLSVSAALEPPRPRTGYRLAGPPPARLSQARQRVLELLAEGPARTQRDLMETAGVGAGVIRALLEAGTLASVPLPEAPAFGLPDPAHARPVLSPSQSAAAAEIGARLRAGGFSCTLIEGVTGAGKTEVYFEAIAAMLELGRQVLVLLPEIALSAQWLERFERRFGVRPAEWHSDVRQGDRRRAWRAVMQGTARVVVGARSALFLPFRDLGLVIVDEEHDPSFKQEDGVCYHARDMAVVRASLAGIPILLASATPSLETRANVDAGRYGRVLLGERHGAAPMPAIEVTDLRRTPPMAGRWIAPPAEALLRATLAAGEQAMLFLNRRGYAPLTLCGACGHRLQCPNCTAWLVEHRFSGRLQCHHCGYAAAPPASCPACGAEGRLKPCGPGVERLEEEARGLFPAARIAVMASDTLAGPRAVAEMVAAMQAGEIDLLIGTQVMAKGHHFPMLTLVVVVDADLGLAGGDLRAGERTYQLLTQVGGRAGRAERPGRVLLQSYMPEHPVLQALAAGDTERFLGAEMAGRREAGMPPFGRLAALILSGHDGQAVAEAARLLARRAPQVAGMSVLGPAPAPLALLRGRHRYRLLVKAARQVNLQGELGRWLAPIRLPSSVRLQIDIDPQSFM
ncbi:MAG: primosomal protein N' [Alphaproteobacteria bacterium]|nr:primosomal protein N' [Alphaproteobacteria bacterium]